jgi:hypothetical protein
VPQHLRFWGTALRYAIYMPTRELSRPGRTMLVACLDLVSLFFITIGSMLFLKSSHGPFPEEKPMVQPQLVPHKLVLPN